MREPIMDQLTAAERLDNIMFTSYPLRRRADIEKAFQWSGMIVDPTCRITYIDRGLLATFRAGEEGGEMEPWMAIDWISLSETDKNTWRAHWNQQR